MKQKIVIKNYLNPQQFYNQFLFWLVRMPYEREARPLEIYKPKNRMHVDQWEVLFRLLYGCGLRVSEALNLTKNDIDLSNRILTIQKAKTGRSKLKMTADGDMILKFIPQKTTILPDDIPVLEKFLRKFNNDEKLFPTDRYAVWKHCKKVAIFAGLELGEIQDHRTIEGAWTHLFRKSCSKRMRECGAFRELRMKKLRHSFRDAHDAYDAVDLPTLILWESEHIMNPIPKESFYNWEQLNMIGSHFNIKVVQN